MNNNLLLRSALAGAGIVAGLSAQTTVNVTADIATSTTWTANNTYNIQNQIYVLPGATLTIEAGTVVASTTNVGGSIAVCKGAQIFIRGTQDRPVIMTSTADVATWVNGNPRTGTAREACNEWGNLTIMGSAYISEDANTANTAAPSAANVATMEGLTAAFPGDTRLLYGGGNDNDDSGSISYCSIRYAGKVIGLNNELNGLSLGGIGRETDIHHVEIWNNVDDGIEIWGGTVNLKCFSIWNVGDDSLDIDQGWRGRAQFGFIVQGSSANAAQGSGVGDNCIEMDGAENSFYQPVTSGVLYNMTVVGQPIDGDHGTAWRDNARMQVRNSIFMDLGERLVAFDNLDGDGGAGYGAGGTLTWAQTWTTDSNVFSTVNAPANPGQFYTAQLPGKLAEIKDSVFFNNNFGTAYTEATNRGVFDASNNNVTATVRPIQSITRGPNVTRGGKIMQPVTAIDPRPAADALVSVGFAPNNGFFTSARYRGAFAPGNDWMSGWTASQAFGITPASAWCDLDSSLAGTLGQPVLSGTGTWAGSTTVSLALSNAKENSLAIFALAFSRGDTPLFGGTIVPSVTQLPLITAFTDASGQATLNIPVPNGFSAGTRFFMQFGIADAGAPFGFAFSNALTAVTP